MNNLPSSTLASYHSSRGHLESVFNAETVKKWEQIGLSIATTSQRSWEAAIVYFEQSPNVTSILKQGQFLTWAELGLKLAESSPPLASQFFVSTPATFTAISPRHLTDWVESVRVIYKGDWKSGKLTTQLFHESPLLFSTLAIAQFKEFANFIRVLALKSADSAIDCLNRSADLFHKLGDGTELFIKIALALADKSWGEAVRLYDAAEEHLVILGNERQRVLLELSQQFATMGDLPIQNVMREGASLLIHFGPNQQEQVSGMVNQLVARSGGAAMAFMRNASAITKRVTFEHLQQWYMQGISLNSHDPNALEQYFALGTNHSKDTLDALSSGVDLGRIENLLHLYCTALSGYGVSISASSELVEKKIGWFQGNLPTTQGNTVYLPVSINRFASKAENFSLYKVMATHQTGLIEFGSFDFDFELAGSLFRNLRGTLEAHLEETVKTKKPPPSAKTQAKNDHENAPEPETNRLPVDIARFFRLFPDDTLAHDIFTVAEGARIDNLVLLNYAGIAKRYRQIQHLAVESRAPIEDLPAQTALMECLIRYSLGDRVGLRIMRQHKQVLIRILRYIKALTIPTAKVEDSAEATIRIYALISSVANETSDADEFETLPEEDTEPENNSPEALEQDVPEEFVIGQFAAGSGLGSSGNSSDSDDTDGDSSMPYKSLDKVDYRGDFKPELGQLMQPTSGEPQDGKSTILSREELEELLRNSPDLNDAPGKEMSADDLAQLSENLLNEMQPRDQDGKFNPGGTQTHYEETTEPLDDSAPGSYLYPEWDFRVGRYKRDWCLIKEKHFSPGEPHFFQETLANNRSLVKEIKTQFELIMPELYRKQKRLVEGEEVDFDAALEALIDLRAKVSPDERVYWRRNKTERSVAVAFLLDMSASTAEAIEDVKQSANSWSDPDDPNDYMVWSRSRKARSYRRIVDIEKEGIVLLVDALENLGDTYGIYGFSGYGRENVEFYIIKDMDEKFDPNLTASCIDRIAPMHATRMGPAIRHTATKLAEHSAKARFLFLISDGRPQDRGYSREGVEKAYAIHDTRMALLEASKMNIRPFCLTVDKAGQDYMKTMMDEFSYEILSDIALLPKRLLQLYRTLTG